MATEGDFTMLPASVLDCIVNFLDIETLAAFYCSCREWYEYLNANESNWEKACKKFGLEQTKDTHPRDWSTWKEYALLIIKRLKEMRNSECFRESSFSIDMADDGGVQAIYYYKNRLAVATAKRIEMWCTTSHRLLFNIVDLPDKEAMRSLSVMFDELHILVADFFHCIRRFGVSSRRQEVVYPAGIARLISYDFENRCDIVVGCYDSNIMYIWKLSSGETVKKVTCASDHWSGKVKIVFIRSPTTNERGLLYLMYLDIESLYTWKVTFGGDIAGDGVDYICSDIINRIDFNHPVWFLSIMNISSINVLSHECSLYINQPRASHSCFIYVLDCDDSKTLRIIKTNEKIKNLLAVGEKYVAFHTTQKYRVGEKIRVIEKTSSKLVATYELPKYKGETVKIVFCDGNWLDGLDLTNDRGVLLAYIWKDKKVHFVEWIPRKGCAA